MPVKVLLTCLAVATAAACNSGPENPEDGDRGFDVVVSYSDIAAEDVHALDSARTYEYLRQAGVNPESLLVALALGGIPVEVAYQPLDNLCLGPLGPAFTVVLAVAELRITDYEFRRGTGRLACATRLRRYTID